MKQIARGLTDSVGFLKQTRHLILDRDPLYTKAFRTMLKDAGIKIVRLPARSPGIGRIRRHQRVGGLLDFYYRAAA